jgi:ketosteroid isomerase-like protein
MTHPTTRAAAEAFYQASEARDLAAIFPLLADDVDWLVQGPVDLFPFLGHRRGRAAVIAGYTELAETMNVVRYQVEALLVDGDRAAALIRLTALIRATGRVMSIRISQFSRFRHWQMVEMRVVLDSFDMVEQLIGRPLDVFAREGQQNPAFAAGLAFHAAGDIVVM